MNTEGHEEVARTAGIPLLAEVFGKDKRSLDALYLGNWLTDVSQAVDPVAYASGSAKVGATGETVIDEVKRAVDSFLDQLVPTMFKRTAAGKALESLKKDLEEPAEAAKKALHQALDGLLAASGTDERSARFAKFFRDAFLVKGYFKFVHPEAGGQPRMNFDAFMTVFGRIGDTPGASGSGEAADRPGSYTQYYPHEHLDRPEILPAQDPPIFAPGRQTPELPFRVAFGKRAGTRSPNRTERLDPDLYSYLRDDIEMTAGLLAEVDIAMREALSKSFRDDDPNWHLTLAKLGHALHQVEDFYAHSNWCELAHKRLGQSYLAKQLPPQVQVEMVDRAYTTYAKRLKRQLTVPLPTWQSHPEEDWVVTGFFDFRDTMISLAHVTHDVFGLLDVPDPYAEGYDLYRRASEAVQHPRTTEFKAEQAMRQALDLLTDPKRAFADRDNEIAAKIKKQYGGDVNRMLRPGVPANVAQQILQETAILKSAPPQIQAAFFDVIVEGARIYTIANTAYSLYGVVKELSGFFGNPIGWFFEWLPDKLKDVAVDALKFYARERFYDLIGADRIGCHSLLAKDHGREPFFTPAKECATAVHWWVVSTLLRWKDHPDAEYVDWLELLEYFLRNPLAPRRGSAREVTGWAQVTLVHTVRWKEQLKAKDPRYSLEAMYKPTAVRPGLFTWRSIADANFNTTDLPPALAMNTINRILRDWGGVPVTPPNYAFKEGMRILIPQQRLRVVFLEAPTDEPLWFKEVFDKGWQVFRGIEDPEGQQSQPPLKPHTPVEVPFKEIERLILRGRKLRREARQAYRPPQPMSVP
jgi:hypothetical protein